MLRNNIKRNIAAVLVFTQLAFWPAVVFGQIVTVPVSDSNNGNNVGGAAGTFQNTAEGRALSAAFAKYNLCLTGPQGIIPAELVASKANVGLSTAAVLSPTGNSTQLAAMNALSGSYLLYFACAMTSDLAFNGDGALSSGLPASSLYTSEMKQRYVSKINSDWAAYTKKYSDLDARIDNANQGFWKTVLISMLLQTSKAVADALVNKLVSNYKITNIKQYTDSLATMAYDNQFIRQNFPNNQDQLIARSFLENPLLRNQIQPAIFVAADAALGYNPQTISTTDPNFYTQMAAAGNANANPYFKQAVYVGSADQARAQSVAAAQQQISMGVGYKAPVNCAGSLAQQKQVDARATALSDQMANRKALLDDLVNSKNAGKNVPDADILKAQSDYSLAKNSWITAPDAISSSSPAVIICEAVSSPAILVNQGIDSLFKAMGGNLTQYNGSNLPSYINMITSTASQIGSSMVLGGLGAGATTALINENKLVTGTAQLASQSASSKTAANLTSGIVFYDSGANSNGSHTLNWSIITSQLTTANFVTVSGGDLPTTLHQPLDGSIGVNPIIPTAYVLTVYDPTGKALGTSSITISPPSPQAFNYNPNAPAVAGAFTQHPSDGAGFTSKPALNIRGPVALIVSPRGN